MSLVTQKWPTCITYTAPLMEMGEPRHGCNLSTKQSTQTDVSFFISCFFGRLHRRLRESGALEVRSNIGRERATRTPVVEETVLQEFAINTQTSLREGERVLGVGRSIIMRRLHDGIQNPYHFQNVQALCADDYPKRIAVSRWYLQQRVAQQDFPSLILFSDESCFTQDSVLNLHNMHVWAHENQDVLVPIHINNVSP